MIKHLKFICILLVSVAAQSALAVDTLVPYRAELYPIIGGQFPSLAYQNFDGNGLDRSISFRSTSLDPKNINYSFSKIRYWFFPMQLEAPIVEMGTVYPNVQAPPYDLRAVLRYGHLPEESSTAPDEIVLDVATPFNSATSNEAWRVLRTNTYNHPHHLMAVQVIEPGARVEIGYWNGATWVAEISVSQLNQQLLVYVNPTNDLNRRNNLNFRIFTSKSTLKESVRFRPVIAYDDMWNKFFITGNGELNRFQRGVVTP